MACLIDTTFGDIDNLTATINELFDHGVPFRVNSDLIISCLRSVPFQSEEVKIKSYAYREEDKTLHLSLFGKQFGETLKLELSISDQQLDTTVEFVGKTKTVPYFLDEFTAEDLRSLWW